MKAQRKARKKKYAKISKEQKKIFVQEYKNEKGCAHCKTKTELTFHHIKPHEKKFEITECIGKNKSWKLIKEEIAKCQVLCRSCHDIVHNTQPKKKKKKASKKVTI